MISEMIWSLSLFLIDWFRIDFISAAIYAPKDSSAPYCLNSSVLFLASFTCKFTVEFFGIWSVELLLGGIPSCIFANFCRFLGGTMLRKLFELWLADEARGSDVEPPDWLLFIWGATNDLLLLASGRIAQVGLLVALVGEERSLFEERGAEQGRGRGVGISCLMLATGEVQLEALEFCKYR